MVVVLSVLSGVDADGGEEALLLGVEGSPAGALPFGPSLDGGGVVLAGVVGLLGLLVGALPDAGPGWVPPGVEGLKDLGGGGGQASSLSGFAACLYEPVAQGETVVAGVFAAGEVTVQGGVGAGVGEAWAYGVDAAGPAAGGGFWGDVQVGQELLLLGE